MKINYMEGIMIKKIIFPKYFFIMKHTSILIILLSVNILYSQTYLIRELKGNIWVTSQVEMTNNNESVQTNRNAKEPIKVNNRVITSEEIERMGYNNAQEVLANQPGFVNKGNYMGNEVVDPAGANGDNIKIYINGILMNTAKGNADAGVDLRRIDSFICRICNTYCTPFCELEIYSAIKASYVVILRVLIRGTTVNRKPIHWRNFCCIRGWIIFTCRAT